VPISPETPALCTWRKQRADLAGLRAGVGQREDATLLVAAELAPLRNGDHLRIGARAFNCLFNLHRDFLLGRHDFGLPCTLISEGQVSQVILAQEGRGIIAQCPQHRRVGHLISRDQLRHATSAQVHR